MAPSAKASALAPLVHETLKITAEISPALLRVDWTGKSAARQPVLALGPYIERLLSEASAVHCPVEMHFEKLEYFNSSTITVVIQMVQSFIARSVPLTIVYNGALSWQRASFEALRVAGKSATALQFRTVRV
jgi:hypothetical protein